MSGGDEQTVVTSRRSVVTDETSATAIVRDGMTIGIGGFINAAHPMALVRQIIKLGLKDLTVVGAASSGLDVDMLVAAGCVRKVVAPYVGAEGLAPIGPAFRYAAQEGLIEVWELDEAHYYAGLRASAQWLPFNPWRAGVGTSYPVVNPDLKEFDDPVAGERLLAIPAIEIDVALVHAAVSDHYGNVQHRGTGYGDRAIHAAADVTHDAGRTTLGGQSSFLCRPEACSTALTRSGNSLGSSKSDEDDLPFDVQIGIVIDVACFIYKSVACGYDWSFQFGCPCQEQEI